MTLRRKTLGIVVGSLVTFLIAVLLLFRFTVYKTFTQLEADVSSGNVQRMHALARNEMLSLQLIARDWHPHATSKAGPTSRHSVDFASKRLSLAGFVGTQTNTVFAQAFDINGGKFTDRAHRFANTFGAIPTALSHAVRTRGGAGFAVSEDGTPMIVALHPVSGSASTPAGWLLLARTLSQSALRQEAAQNQFTVSVVPLEESIAVKGTPQATSRFDLNTSFQHTNPTGFDVVTGRKIMADILSGAPLLLQVDMPRSVFARGFIHAAVLSLSLVTMSLLCILITLWLLNRHVLSRLTSSIRHLRRGLHSLAADADLSGSLGMPESDEFSALAEAINDLLDALRTAQDTSRQQERQMAQSEKLVALGTLVSGVAHEINTPTNYINLNAEMLERHLTHLLPLLDERAEEDGDFSVGKQTYKALRPKLVEMASGIHSGGRAIQRIVEDLKGLSQQDESRVPGPVDLNACLEKSARMLQNEIDVATDRFSLTQDPEAPTVIGDAQKLEQVFTNLIQNACQSLTSRNAAVSVNCSSAPSESSATVIVSDEGCGIESAILDRIREPFFTTRRNNKGTGLGLYVTNMILEKHNARLKVESKLGTGSRFKVTFPTVPFPTAPPTQPKA